MQNANPLNYEQQKFLVFEFLPFYIFLMINRLETCFSRMSSKFLPLGFCFEDDSECGLIMICTHLHYNAVRALHSTDRRGLEHREFMLSRRFDDNRLKFVLLKLFTKHFLQLYSTTKEWK